MKIVNYSHARKNFRNVLDEVEQSNEPTCIVSKNNQTVLISKKMYDQMIDVITRDK